MHRMHLGLLISIPVGRVLLRVLGQHLLLIVLLVLMWRSHRRWHGCIRAIVSSLRRLHGHGMLPIGMVILLHVFDRVAFRTFFARTWC